MTRYEVVIPPDKPDAPTWLERTHGIKCWNQDGVQVADSPDAQALIDGYDPLPAAKPKLKLATLAEAHARVVELTGDDRQQSLAQARASQLILRKVLGTITAQETAQLEAIEALLERVQAIEAAAEAIAADIDALPDVAAAEAFNVADPDRWPA